MSVSLTLMREPVTVTVMGITMTLKRLTTPELHVARQRALSLVRSPERLIQLVERLGLWPRDERGRRRPSSAWTKNADVLLGLGHFVGVVECALSAISAWDAVDDNGAPLPVSREALCLIEAFETDLLEQMQKAAMLLAREGKGFGPSPNGSTGSAPMASARNTATDAAPSTGPAPEASLASAASSAPRASTRRKPSKG
jgi:hypothetical protein